MNTTSNHQAKLPSNEVAPSSKNGHSTGSLESSRGTGLNAQLARENAKLVQERDLLRTLIDGLPDNIFVKDRQSRFLISNLAHVRTLGATRPDEVMGKSDRDIFPAEAANQYYEDEQALMKSGQPLNREETVMIPGTSEKRWVQTTKVPLRDKQGTVVGLMGINRDITEMKQTVEALRESQALSHSLLEQLPMGIFRKDREGRFVLVNSEFCRIKGMKAEEFLGKTPLEVAAIEAAKPGATGPANTYAAVGVEHHERIMQTGKPIEMDEEYVKADGTKQFLHVVKLPMLDSDGKIIGTQGIQFDITERKQAEESLARERLLLRTLIDNLPDCIYAKDTAGRKTMANPADLKNLRCKFESEAIGKSDFDLFPPDIAEKFWADDQLVLKGQPVLNREEFLFDEQSRKHWLMTSKLPLRDQGGKIVGLVGIGRDITERKQAEDDLRSSEEKLRQFTVQLERSNRELQDFAYVASHDLQEPLRKIVVFGERLREKNSEALGPEALDYLDRMQKAAARMQILINDLLTFSRVTTKAQPFTSVNLAEVASGVLEDLEGRIELVKGRVELGALPVIDAESLQMRQLLQNLIGNALKFRRPEEPPVVKVEAQIIPDSLTPAKKLCRLTVSDNCIGFDEKYLDRIFNVFQRLHTRNEYEGTGMGLAIVRKIALYHGGDITAKSKPGQGSTFILTIPVAHPKKAQDDNKETTIDRKNQP